MYILPYISKLGTPISEKIGRQVSRQSDASECSLRRRCVKNGVELCRLACSPSHHDRCGAGRTYSLSVVYVLRCLQLLFLGSTSSDVTVCKSFCKTLVIGKVRDDERQHIDDPLRLFLNLLAREGKKKKTQIDFSLL